MPDRLPRLTVSTRGRPSPAKPPACRLALAILPLLAACATRVPPATPLVCAPPGQPRVMAELLFGLSTPTGSVSPAAFDAFVAAEISPRFPAGLSVLPATGRWQPPGGQQIAEASRIVVIVADDSPDTADRLHAIRAAYRSRFAQKSVGLITIQSCASF